MSEKRKSQRTLGGVCWLWGVALETQPGQAAPGASGTRRCFYV